jgi:hypothetical protein
MKNDQEKMSRKLILCVALSVVFHTFIFCKSIERKAYEAKLYTESIENKEDIVNDSNKFVRFFLAMDTTIDSKNLARLAEDSEEIVRIGVCRNPNISKETLDMLLTDSDNVKIAIIKNFHVSDEYKRKLAKDESPTVRKKLADITKDPETLSLFMSEVDEKVIFTVIKNPFTPKTVLQEYSKYKNTNVRMWLASSAMVPEEVLRELAKDENKLVRKDVLKNKNTPVDAIIDILKMDTDLQEDVAGTTDNVAVLEWLVDLNSIKIMERIFHINKSYKKHKEILLKHKYFAWHVKRMMEVERQREELEQSFNSERRLNEARERENERRVREWEEDRRFRERFIDK